MLLLHERRRARGAVPGAARLADDAALAGRDRRVLHVGRHRADDRGGARLPRRRGGPEADARARDAAAAAGLLPRAAAAAQAADLLRPRPHPRHGASRLGRLHHLRAPRREHRRVPRAQGAGAPHHRRDRAADAHARGQHRRRRRRHRRPHPAAAVRLRHPARRGCVRQAVRAVLHRRPRRLRLQRSPQGGRLLPRLARVRERRAQRRRRRRRRAWARRRRSPTCRTLRAWVRLRRRRG
mmetsp:Transcript_13539/g.44037  ORF Transcript_13539/g.44037 Transcript_13539/m.44037 type:complete len:239 (+) Transcript_13539:582-1298(+)